MGNYSFKKPIEIGDRLYFEDMAIYSFVKNNTFNGIGLPSLYLMDKEGECSLVKSFGYQDFREIIMMDSPKKLGYRMPAEYEPHHGTLMIWPTRPGSWPFKERLQKSF